MTGERAVYLSEEAALHRAAVLKRPGIWTGCQRAGDGWVLLFDPDMGGAP